MSKVKEELYGLLLERCQLVEGQTLFEVTVRRNSLGIYSPAGSFESFALLRTDTALYLYGYSEKRGRCELTGAKIEIPIAELSDIFCLKRPTGVLSEAVYELKLVLKDGRALPFRVGYEESRSIGPLLLVPIEEQTGIKPHEPVGASPVTIQDDPDPNERQSRKILKIVLLGLLSVIAACPIAYLCADWFQSPWLCLTMTGICWILSGLCYYLSGRKKNVLYVISVFINGLGLGFATGALSLGYGQSVPFLYLAVSIGGFALLIAAFALIYFFVPRKLVSDILCGLISLAAAITLLVLWLRGYELCRTAFLFAIWLIGFCLAFAGTVDTDHNALRTSALAGFAAAFSVIIIVAVALLALLTEGEGCDSCDCCDGCDFGSGSQSKRKRK